MSVAYNKVCLYDHIFMHHQFIFRMKFYGENAFISIIWVNVFLHLRFSYICSKMTVIQISSVNMFFNLVLKFVIPVPPQGTVRGDFTEHYSSYCESVLARFLSFWNVLIFLFILLPFMHWSIKCCLYCNITDQIDIFSSKVQHHLRWRPDTWNIHSWW